MVTDRSRLHIAVQKSGRLSDQSKDLLKGAGLKLQGGKNALTARAENFPLDLMFVRDDDIPTFVSDGVCEPRCRRQQAAPRGNRAFPHADRRRRSSRSLRIFPRFPRFPSRPSSVGPSINPRTPTGSTATAGSRRHGRISASSSAMRTMELEGRISVPAQEANCPESAM